MSSELSTPVPAPEWIETGAEEKLGIDVLGLRYPTNMLGATLLPGITTVTPRIRYLSVRAWCIYRYAQLERPDDTGAFTAFASKFEGALALGNLLVNPDLTGVIGADRAQKLLGESGDRIELERLVRELAQSVYGAPADQLYLTYEGPLRIPGLTRERGERLALLFEESVAGSALGRRFIKGREDRPATRRQLKTFGEHVRLDRVPRAEADCLREILIPSQPQEEDIQRRETYATLLAVTQRKGRRPGGDEIVDFCVGQTDGLPSQLHLSQDLWALYATRSLLALAHERTLGAVLEHVPAPAVKGSGLPAREVISILLAEAADRSDILSDHALLDAGETIESIRFKDLAERVDSIVSKNAVEREGLVRWEGGLQQQDLRATLYQHRIAGPLLLPVIWLVARARTRRGVEQGIDHFGRVSFGGWARIGMKQVILPTLARFEETNPSLLQVIGDLAHRTVQQHQRIAWARFAQDPRRDIALLLEDGERWLRRSRYPGGTSESRIPAAMGWLEQIGLIAQSGLTKEGKRVLDEVLADLDHRGAP